MVRTIALILFYTLCRYSSKYGRQT